MANIEPVEWANGYGKKWYQPHVDGKRLWITDNLLGIPWPDRKEWLRIYAPTGCGYAPKLYRSRKRATRMAERQFRRDKHQVNKKVREVKR